MEIPCLDGPPLILNVKSRLHKSQSMFQDIAVVDTENFGKCLFLDGLIQCTQSDHELYDRHILAKIRPSDRRLLILGGGDGYIAQTAFALNPHLEITIVDLDRAVVDVCREYLAQSIFERPNLKLVINDALHFLMSAPKGHYDGVVCDLTDFPVGFENKKILNFYTQVFSHVQRVMKPEAWMSGYAGIKSVSLGATNVAALLNEELKRHFSRVELKASLIPSFGEQCYFLYASTPEQVAERCDVSQFREVMKVIEAVSADGLADWDESESYILDKLANPKNLNIILRDGDRITGYMLAIPQNDACSELIEADPDMPSHGAGYYVMLTEILPSARKKQGFTQLIYKMVEEAATRFHVPHFSMHVRVNTGLSDFVQRHFCNMNMKVRRIDAWKYYADQGPADYIEGSYVP